MISIGATDSAIVILYMIVVLGFGLWVGRGGHSRSDYFLGDRSMPWWALLLSIVATETSTVTFLSIPGIAAAANGNLTFLQITIGYVAGRLFVVFVLLPLYFQGKLFTAYEVLESRFGTASRRMVSTVFLLTRNTSDALRLFLTALVLQIVLGLDLNISVVVIGVVTILYTFIGGARSVIWNDCIQFLVYMFGAAAAVVIIGKELPDGIGGLLNAAGTDGKLQVFDFSAGLSQPGMTFWAGLFGGAFLTAATHGTDQLMVQRYLAARSQKEASFALGLSGFVVMLQFAIFLFIGIGLAGLFGSEANAIPGDQLFARFIVDYMPTGILGLTLAAVFAAAMSTLSSSLNSSAAALVNDLYLPLRPSVSDERSVLHVSRLVTIGFGLLQIFIALGFGALASDTSIVANVLKVSGFAAGPVLGLYLLGVLFVSVGQRAALAAFLAGVAVLSYVAYATQIHWAWYALIGSAVAVTAGIILQRLLGSENERPNTV